MAIWRTADGGVLWDVGGDVFVQFAVGMTGVRAVHERGSYSYEDELYEWTVRIEGGELRKRTTITQYGEEPSERTSTLVAGLVPISGSSARESERIARGVYEAHKAGRRGEALAREQEDLRLEQQFIAALPEPCSHLVFRRAGSGWSVALKDDDEPFWEEMNWGWRGKDLHHQLRNVLLRYAREFESFTEELTNLDEEMCYHGE